MQDGGFVLVKTRRKKHSKTTFNTTNEKVVLKQGQTTTDTNADVALKKVLEAKGVLSGSQFLDNTIKLLQTSLKYLEVEGISEIICYGLGHFTECAIARYQLALLLIIAETFNAKVYIHDPVFYNLEVRLLEELGLNIIPDNEEGKRKLSIGAVTLLYLPHCSKQLTNNFLWYNWSPELKNCILLGNSFSESLSAELNRNCRVNTHYIQRIQPYTKELKLENTFKFQDVFNNTSIHTFSSNTLSTLEGAFWDDCEEPFYKTENTEFIKNSL